MNFKCLKLKTLAVRELVVISFLFLFFGKSFSQEKIRVKPDTNYTIELERYSKPITRDSLTIQQAIFLNFSKEPIDNPIVGKDHWARFQIEVNQIQVESIDFVFSQSDELILYIPQVGGGYKQYQTGLLIFEKPIVEFNDASKIHVTTKNIDFDKHFYVKNTPLSFFGYNAVYSDFLLTAYRSSPTFYQDEQRKVIQDNENFEFIFAMLIGMIVISFIFMMIHFLIIKKVYFLYYSLYMFCLIFNYGYRTFFFYNFYAEVKPILYFYFNQNGQLLAQLFYMFFYRSFIEIKLNYPKLNKVNNWTIVCFIGVIVFYNSMIIINPYWSDHLLFMSSAIYLITLVNFGYLIYAFLKKNTIETRIITIGTICLIIGYIVAIKSNFFILVPIVAIEAAIFMSVLSYLDLKKYKIVLESKKEKEMNALKSEFYTNITHEFRTPLTLISLPIQEKLESQSLSEKDQADFEMIQRNNQRLLGLVDQLLQISKAESGLQKLQIQKGNVLKVIKILANTFFYTAKQSGIKFTINIDKTVKETWFDKDIVEKVTMNLLSNAMKYTPDKGQISCNATVKKKVLYLEVKNTGQGLSIEQAKKVFDRFYQVDEHQPGSGIGLSLVKELVKLHKGKISVESEPNIWTVFKVELAVGRNDFKASDMAIDNDVITFSTTIANKSIEKNLKTANYSELPIVLIVEDNEDLRMLLNKTFIDEYKVFEAENGEKGIKLAQKYIPDLIISDVMMPIKDGIELTNELKNDERTSHIPIILLTAKVGEEHELKGIQTGADDYIIKPFNKAILTYKVNNIISGRQKIRELYQKESEIQPGIIAVNSVEEKFWNKTKEILNTRLKDSSFTANEFCKEMNMSRMTLHRKLRSLTGLSTTEFINNERLKIATHFLKNSDLHISEIATDVGFDTISYFNKCFKETYQCTPTEYREKV
ncbi:response regulator [Aquimarina gracilis]|uniref:histidine kinase n=1 Tax=Aquimarina gracilis TaxID=874422 RepID=A0ABU5ZZC4_9FLAO|nr:response regulator [Aquimarina gracilis]MEB3347175.1 response regulator [Aquimarina gracilis]